MLVAADVSGFIDQQHGDTGLDAVGPAQPWVVEPVVDEQQRSAVGGAYQDLEKLRVHVAGLGVHLAGLRAYGIGGMGGAVAGGGVATTFAGLPGPGAAPAPIAAPCWDCALLRISICAFSFCW